MLFYFSYVMLGVTSFASELRQLIAKCVSSDPQLYNSVFLGQENTEYCKWILDEDHWGGILTHLCILFLAACMLVQLNIKTTQNIA